MRHPPLFSSHLTTGWKALTLHERTHDPYVADVVVPPVDAYCIVVVTAGSAFRELWDGHQWSGADFRTGSAALTPPGQETRARWRTTSLEPFTTAEILLPHDTVRAAARELGLRRHTPPLRAVPFLTDEVVTATTRALLDAGRSGVTAEAYVRSAGAFLAMQMLARHGNLPQDELTLRVLGSFHDAFRHPTSLRELAAAAGVGQGRLKQVVRAATGHSPGRYLTGLRMAEAKRLLADTTLPVTEICYACGFSSPSHFAATFRRATGTSPSGWRRDARQRRAPVLHR